MYFYAGSTILYDKQRNKNTHNSLRGVLSRLLANECSWHPSQPHIVSSHVHLPLNKFTTCDYDEFKSYMVQQRRDPFNNQMHTGIHILNPRLGNVGLMLSVSLRCYLSSSACGSTTYYGGFGAGKRNLSRANPEPELISG